MPATGAMVELQLGSTWTDVTADVYLRDGLRITRGRQDQGARVDPGSCSFTLNNKGGRYSPRNPLSPLYGQIGRNTPVRVSVPGPSTYLTLNGSTTSYASTPDAAALDITSDIDLRTEIELADWSSTLSQTLISKWDAPGGQRSYMLRVFNNQLVIGWSTDGVTELFAAVVAPAGMPRRVALRATLDVDNGAGGYTATFYWSSSITGPWTQFGTVTGVGVTSIFGGTAHLQTGTYDATSATIRYPAAGTGLRYEVRSGVGGTVVANPDFTIQTPGATSFTDGAGRVWTVPAAALSNRLVRFQGEVSSWPSRWDVSGGDVFVPVQAAGILRRLGQGASPLDSTLRRRIPSEPTLVAYWPMEDGRDAVQAYSPLAGVAPMATTGLSFGADDSLAGSSPLPTVGTGATIRGLVPAAAGGTWQIEFVYRIPTAPSGDANAEFLVFTTTAGYTWRVGVGATNLHLDVTASDGTSVLSRTVTPGVFFDGWSRAYVQASQSGGNLAYEFGWYTIGGIAHFISGTAAGTSGAVTAVATAIAPALAGMTLGHIAVFSALNVKIFNGGDTGFAEEDAVTRYVRLCTEEGVPGRVPYSTAGTALVGPQRPDALLNLLEEAQDADVGVLYEARESIALSYRPRVSLYNQTVTLALDYTVRGEVAPPLEPVEDDTATRNDITISRPNGSSARATLDTGALSTQAPPLGVGRYTTSETRNVQTDDQLPDLAAWLLHLGTWDEARYPQVTVNLAAGPWLTGNACTVDIGDLIGIANPPPWLPPGTISLMCQGYTETLGVYEWTITYNCTPGGPWTVGVLDDPVLGRADTDGSSLASAATATATSLSVAVTAGPLWVTTAANPGEFPFDAVIAGEVVTVTGITGTSSPQTWTVTRGTNGITKPLPTGADVRLATPMILAL